MTIGDFHPWTWWQRWLMTLSIIPAFGIVLSLMAPLWIGQICCNWTMQASFALLPALLICAWRPRWAFSILMLIALGSSRWIISGYERRLPVPSTNAPSLRVVSANIAEWNPWRRQAITRAGRDYPDLLCLIEVTEQDHRTMLKDSRWPYQVWATGIGLLSTQPFLSHQAISSCETPVLQATIALGGSTVRLLAWHVLSPTTPQRQNVRNRQLAHMATLLAGSHQPTLLMGDFNLTVGDPQWRQFAADSGLLRPIHESASWPSIFGPCGITIDHFLAYQLAVAPVSPVWMFGSDHLGISTRIATCDTP
jgi:endonuclease/exonuclease/phosphatase (EEP) superfamily protein YafD